MTETTRTAQKWGGLTMGLIFVLIGLTFLGGNVVIMIGGAVIAVCHGVWIVRTSRRRPSR